MRIITAILLSGAALSAAAGVAMADGAVDTGKLAASAAPEPPPTRWLMVISKTPDLEVPGLPMTTKQKNREGTAATTLTIVPATGGPAAGSVSWSGYTRAGAVYRKSN